MNVKKEQFDKLRELFDGIPESCFYLNIIMEVGKPIIIETKFYAEEELWEEWDNETKNTTGTKTNTFEL